MCVQCVRYYIVTTPDGQMYFYVWAHCGMRHDAVSSNT